MSTFKQYLHHAVFASLLVFSPLHADDTPRDPHGSPCHPFKTTFSSSSQLRNSLSHAASLSCACLLARWISYLSLAYKSFT